MQESQHRIAVPVGVWLIDTKLIPLQPFVPSRRVMWNDTDTPLAYFISFRAYGTWLHGDKRGSIDRFHNRYRAPYIQSSDKWQHYNEQRLRSEPLILKARHRKSIEAAIRETCNIRKWLLYAINVRTNHVHTVVSANRKAGLVLNAFKANATRQLREDGLWLYSFSPWADKGSKRRLWNEQSVARAIDYVLNGQGDDLPDFD
jgi:REP element-mobilizing transposase RayT